jgi:hypothetical protein
MKNWLVIVMVFFALATQIPAADFDGDGTDDIAIFRPDTGLWAVKGVSRYYFGSANDVPIEGDYNGDGTDDTVIFRSSIGLWAARYITRSYWGRINDIPIGGCCGFIGTTPTPISATTIEINEINWGGTIGQGTPGGQWIELYNYGGSSVSLSNWTLYNSSQFWTLTLSGTIGAGNYFVLADDATDSTGGKRDLGYDTSSYPLGSSGDQLVLKDASDNAVDTVSCNSGWAAGEANYHSMERINPELGNCSSSNWNTAIDLYGGLNYGTPGEQNSQQLSASRSDRPLQSW